MRILKIKDNIIAYSYKGSISFGLGNNPMVGATVAVAVAVEKALNK